MGSRGKQEVKPVEEQVNEITKQMSQLQQEYPELPRKAPNKQTTSTPVKGRFTYAQLASTWAEQSKENEAKAKKAEEEEADRRRFLAKMNEVKVVPVSQKMVAKKKRDSDDELDIDIGCHVSDHSENLDPSESEEDVVEDEVEEEPEEDPDAFWTQRKHKNDLY